jgi:hypothetical protein
MGVVVVEREPLEVVVHPHPEVIGDPLPHALRVVAVDVRRQASERGEEHQAERRHGGQRRPVRDQRRAEQPGHPLGSGMMPDRIVDHDLQRPRTCQTGGRLDHHGQQDDDQPPAVGARKIGHQTSSACRRSVRRGTAQHHMRYIMAVHLRPARRRQGVVHRRSSDAGAG